MEAVLRPDYEVRKNYKQRAKIHDECHLREERSSAMRGKCSEFFISL
jgi:hypothetical protein